MGVTSAQESSLVPGVQPVSAQGVDGFEVIAWNALYAPRGTPAATLQVLNQALNKVLAQPDTRQRLLELGFEPAGGPARQLASFATSEREKWGPIIRTAGIEAN